MKKNEKRRPTTVVTGAGGAPGDTKVSFRGREKRVQAIFGFFIIFCHYVADIAYS